MKEWIEAFVREVLAWLVFFRDTAHRVHQLIASMEYLERDIDAALAAITERNQAMVN